MRPTVLAVLATAVVLAGPVRAEPLVTPEFRTGGRTPIGYYGVALDVQPLSWVSVAGGIGLSNFQGSSQTQVFLAPRLRWPALPWLALDAGMALSRGQRSDYVAIPAGQTSTGAGGSVTRSWIPGYRLGPELGVELAPLPRGRLRLYGGLAYPLEEARCWVALDGSTPEQWPCGNPQVPALARDNKAEIYLGLAVGWSLSSRPVDLPLPAKWYGWQTLLIDSGAAVLLALSDPDGRWERTPLTYAAEQQAPLVFVAGGPIVHLTHRRQLPALGSLLLRGGLLGTAFLLGFEWDRNECIRFDCLSNKLMAAGAVVSSVVDAAWLAWER